MFLDVPSIPLSLRTEDEQQVTKQARVLNAGKHAGMAGGFKLAVKVTVVSLRLAPFFGLHRALSDRWESR